MHRGQLSYITEHKYGARTIKVANMPAYCQKSIRLFSTKNKIYHNYTTVEGIFKWDLIYSKEKKMKSNSIAKNCAGLNMKYFPSIDELQIVFNTLQVYKCISIKPMWSKSQLKINLKSMSQTPHV